MASEENSSRARIKITPELFSITHLQYYIETRYAFLQDLPPEQTGELMNDLPLERPESDKELHQDQRREIKHRRAYLATAAMEMVYGNYRQALDALEYAENGYRKYFPREHISRLEISSFRALLLALNSKPIEAEGLCKRTFAILGEERGYKHPLTLVTMSILVQIQLKMWHFFPAMDTATTLVRRTTKTLGENDILTLHSRAQLAAAKFHHGDYYGAETDLESVIPILEGHLLSEHPDMFQYQCLLAKVYLKRGKFEAAEKRLVPVLEMKPREYSKDSRRNEAAQTDVDTGFPEYGLTDFLNTFVKDPKAAFSGTKPHPQFLSALAVYADILFQQQSPAGFAISIHRATWLQQKIELGNSHLDTVATLYRLAVLTRETKEDYESYIEVREQLEEVTKARNDIFGGSHASTLCALREDLVLGYNIRALVSPGPWVDNAETDPIYFQGKDVFAESHYIYECHKSRLGRFHPETIQSLYWLFKLRVSKSFHEQTCALANELLDCLKVVRDDCPVFSLSLECSVAFLFYEFGYYRTAKQISVRTTEAIDHYLTMGDREMRWFLERLRSENLGFIDHLCGKLGEERG
ncbi:uncharacterized protein F4807DRAFT_462419 [Annulohypoxylon truncatum]|uniref:uncharacterized protein n=1 Tax=Annulohypoxylon truncatum TaxID=327061 RepID=UPI00200763A6|nr:uncharacterized protein F4807DRAFT_462419 [Annulohypoxylon truncatum]KAI1207610.1 hypothetical protein F4807DRAFT_462419 [Annulohypoxylon truncatum]